MTVDLTMILTKHRFFSEMEPKYLQILASCGQIKAFNAGDFLAKEGDPSDYFYALLDGSVAIESYHPGRQQFVLQTLHGGDVVGWSWLFPPYRWVFDARIASDTEVISFEARCIKRHFDTDPAFGFSLMKRFAEVMVLRLKATRLQLLDIYEGQVSD